MTERDPVRAALADKIACANLVTKDVIVAALNAPLPGRLDCGAAEALKPFAKIADLYDDREDDTFRLVADMDIDAIKLLTLGACRKARAALALPPTLNSGAVETKLAGSEPLGPLYDGTTMDNQKPDAGPGGSMTTALLPQTGDGDPVRAALADACREAFDSESVSLKNIILRKAHDALRDHLPPTLNSGAVERMREALELFVAWDDGTQDGSPVGCHNEAMRLARDALALPRAVDGGALPQAGPGSGGAGGQSIAGAGVAGIEQPRTYGEYCKNPSDTVAPCSPDLLKAMDYKWQP